MIKQVDHRDVTDEMIAVQYSESPKLLEYIKKIADQANELEDVIWDVLTKRTIDKGTGIILDVIGRIVGQPRVLINASLLSYFGFSPNPAALGFNVGRLRGPGEPIVGNRTLTDEEYRLFIRARIFKNHSAATPEEIITAVGFLFQSSYIVFIENEFGQPAQATIGIGRLLTPNEQVFLLNGNLIPRQICVDYDFFQFDASGFFGFAGVPGAKGFNEGRLAKRIT